MEPLVVCLWILLGVCLVTWILSVITHEHSWVDRIWSIVPVAYAWVFAGSAGFEDPRLLLVASLITLWGARLTFNFARKGGYARGGEDYRWARLRSGMSPAGFAVFNVLFIVIYQNVLLLAITLPLWTAFRHPTPLTPLDALAGVAFLACLVGETIADQQQWDFHAWKRVEEAAGRTPRPRFLQTGLFRFSRHPNFFFEQAQWWIVFLFGAIAARSLAQWTVVGAVLLLFVFIGSTRFTETISRERYPEYRQYQKRTSAVVPWIPYRGDPVMPAEAVGDGPDAPAEAG